VFSRFNPFSIEKRREKRRREETLTADLIFHGVGSTRKKPQVMRR
jgi:hypothetical protein